MKKIYKLFLCAVGVMMLFSCVKENFEQPQVNETPEVNETPDGYEMVEFSATTVDTKTTVEVNADGTHGATLWAKGDQLSIFWNNGKGTADLEGEGGANIGKFKGSVPQGVKATHAVYPSSVAASVAGNTVKVSIPAEQPGTFSAGNISVAEVAEDNSLAFNNINAFLCVQLVSDEVTKIHVKSVGGHALVGTVPVTFTGEGAEFSAAEGTASEVTMTAGKKGHYYISIVPGVQHDGGLLLTYYKGEEVSGTYFFDKNLNVVANKIYNFGEFEPDGNYYVSVEGAGKKNGVSMANAMPVAKMTTLLQKSTADAAALAAVDGAVFHFAAGEYELAEQALNLSYTGEPVKLTFKAEGEVSFSGNETHSIMSVSGADVTLEGITVTKSVATESNVGAIKVSGENTTLTLDNCQVYGNTVDGEQISCAGIAVLEGAGLVIKDCVFTKNNAYSTAVLYVNGGDVTATESHFESNWVDASVGVMLLEGAQTASFTNCEFIDNHAYQFGMIQHVSGQTTFTNCNFKDNGVYKTKFPGVFQLDEGGSGKLTIIGGECSGNEAGNCGVANQEATGAELVMTDVVIKENYGKNGDGAIWSAGKCTLTRCTIANNTSDATDKKIGQSLTICGQEFAMYGCVIENTTGKKSSNAVAITGDARVIIGADSQGNRSIIRNNTADWGGAVTLSGTSAAVIYDTDIIGNHAKGAGAIRIVDNTSLTLTDCVLKDNYTTGGNGGAFAFESTGNCYCNRCHFEGNYAQNEGGAIKVDNSSSAMFLNACTFKGNYQKKPAGTTIQINNNGSFAMNNCTIADDTYSETGNADMPAVSWLSFVKPNKMWFSNNTFIGVPRLNGELTNGGLVRIWFEVETEAHFVNNIVVTDEQENVWSFCQLDQTIGQDYTPSVCLYHTKYSKFENVSACESVITFMENPTSSGFSKNSFGDLAWNADKCYWSWNGTMTSGANKNMITASQFIATLDNVMPEFKTWLMSVDGLYKDQLGNSRGNGAWWPGSYQGAEYILGGDFGNAQIPEYDEEDILADM